MSVSVFAQTRATFINEHFDGNSLPEGWQIIGQTSNWSVSATQNAGGEANEMKLDWSPQFNGMTRLVTPAVDLTGISSVVFSFKHALDNYQGSNSIGVATSSDGGTTWNDGWTHSYNTSNSWAVMENITTADMGNSNVMFCIYFNGSSYNINDWYFDDIEIYTQENLDAQLATIDVGSVIEAGTKDIACTVMNKGIETITEVTMSYQIDNNTAVVETFPVNLASFQSAQLTFADPVMFLPGTYNLTMNIEAVNGTNDDDPGNNSLAKTIGVSLGSTQRIPMIEHFSSSTCGPCVSVNTTMLSLCNNNPGKFTYTKYQMNWPGNGDPYYTAEGGVRRTYYGVSAVPQCFLDGQDQGYAAVSQATLDNHYNSPAFTDVRGSFNVSGNTITVKVDFMSYYDLNTAKAFVSVNEKETHGNVGTNGETSFHHIFMAFMTEATGMGVNIPAGGYQHFEFTQDLTGTHVEEMSDLEVSAWMQELGTKEMLNSHFMYEYTDEHPYPVENLTVGDAAITWEAPGISNPVGYNVFINGEQVAESIAETSYAYASSDFFVAEVQAVYSDGKTSVKIARANADGPAPQTELTLSATELVYAAPEETQILTITNNTASDVTISEIAEIESNYLNIEFDETLPFVLPQGGSMEVAITPDNIVAKENFDVALNIVSTVGTQYVIITLDSSWYDGIAENGSSYEIYPNPTNGNITVSGANINMVEVYNLCGQKVASVNGSQNVNVDMSSLNSGVYMVKVIENNGNSTVNKVVKR